MEIMEAKSSSDPNQNKYHEQFEKTFGIVTNRVTSATDAFNKFIELGVKFLICLFQHIWRKLRGLPFVITGTNPYAFSSDGYIYTSIYSKVQVHLFGWAALAVVAYVTVASQKIAENYAILNGSSAGKYIFSATMGTIVFFCDRFILSFPRRRSDITDVILENRINRAASNPRKILLSALRVVRKFVLISTWSSIVLTIFRLCLALTVSGLLLLTMYLEMNTHKVNEYINRKKEESVLNFYQSLPEYGAYQNAMRREYRAYFEKVAAERCQKIALQGVAKENSVKADDAALSTAPRGVFEISPKPTLNDFICGISDSRPCRGEQCPEYKRQSIILGEKTKVFNEETTARVGLEANLLRRLSNDSNADRIRNSPVDFATRIDAVLLMNEGKDFRKSVTEILIYAPILVLLLAFELLPAIAKICFPASAYEHMIAWEETYLALVTYTPQTEEIKGIISAFSDEGLKFNTISTLRNLDALQKRKDAEIRVAATELLDSVNPLVSSVLGLSRPLTVIICILLILTLLVVGIAVIIQFFANIGRIN